MEESLWQQCRICLDRGQDLIRPCNCRGTVEYVHASCIQMWLRQRREQSRCCELCGYKFELHVRTRTPFWFFFSPGSINHWLHLLYIAFVARRMWLQFQVLTRVITTKSPKGRSSRFVWRLILHSFTLGHYTAFLLFDVRNLLRRWLRWRHMTSELVVYSKHY